MKNFIGVLPVKFVLKQKINRETFNYVLSKIQAGENKIFTFTNNPGHYHETVYRASMFAILTGPGNQY